MQTQTRISFTHHDRYYDETYTTIAYHFISAPGMTTTGGVVPPRPRRLTCPAPFANSVLVLVSASNSTFELVLTSVHIVVALPLTNAIPSLSPADTALPTGTRITSNACEMPDGGTLTVASVSHT